MSRVYKKQIIAVLKAARKSVAKPFGWGKHQYQRTAVIKFASTEHALVDLRGVEVPPGTAGLFAHYTGADVSGEQVNCVCAVGAVHEALDELGLDHQRGAGAKLCLSVIQALEGSLPKSYVRAKNTDGAPLCVEEFNDLRGTSQRSVINLFDRAIRALEG